MLASMASFTLPNPALVRTVHLRRPAAQLLRWASRRIPIRSLNARMFDRIVFCVQPPDPFASRRCRL